MNHLKRFSIHSMIIGIAIGMIISGIANILLLNNNTSSIAEIDQDFFLKITNQEEANTTNKASIDYMDANSSEDNDNKNGQINHVGINNNDYREIYINKGMNSEEIAKLLCEKEIILDSNEFIDLTNKLEMSKKLKYGLKKIPLNSTMEDILEILVKSN